VVREITVAGALVAAGAPGAGAETVAAEVAGAALCVCADASTAAARIKMITARDRFFTKVLDPGGELADF